MNIVNVGYDSTHYYVIGQGRHRLLIDAGFPRTLPKLLANLKRMDIELREITHFLSTHYHPDHAGLAPELMGKGVRLIVLESQVEFVPKMKAMLKPADAYAGIALQDAIRFAAQESRAFLKSIGIAGEIVSTPGHSDDSITLVLDDGEAFTGDLPGVRWAGEEAMAKVAQSWQAILALNAERVHPGHGPIRPAADMAEG